MQYKSLLVVIPTRNRADLAINAINSVLSQENCSFEILISDNSTEEQEVEKLSAFCAELNDKRLHYVRPPRSLSMTEHWDWAMRQALQISEFSHVVYLTDRMLFRRGSLRNIQYILTKFPDKLLSYSTDSIDEREFPITLSQFLWTGKLFEVSSAFTLKLYAGLIILSNHALPKMLNSVAPRKHITAMLERYGNVFSSISPDYSFGFRSLTMVDSVLYYDRALLVAYSSSRSNGTNAVAGNFNKEVADFINNLNSTDVSFGFDTPIKHFYVLPNCITCEYYNVTQEEKNRKFPQIDQDRYLLSLVDSVFSYKNKEIKQELLKKLRSELGYSLLRYRAQSLLERKFKGLKIKLYNFFNPSQPYMLKTYFESVEDAIEYAIDSPREPVTHFNIIENRTGEKPSKTGPIKLLGEIADLM